MGPQRGASRLESAAENPGMQVRRLPCPYGELGEKGSKGPEELGRGLWLRGSGELLGCIEKCEAAGAALGSAACM